MPVDRNINILNFPTINYERESLNGHRFKQE
jgi:hypothetical protein